MLLRILRCTSRPVSARFKTSCNSPLPEFSVDWSSEPFNSSLRRSKPRAVVYYSPEYTGKSGETYTVEANAELGLPEFIGISPSISGAVGSTINADDNANFATAFGNGDDSYMYWNAGLGLGLGEVFSIDLRYWDTDVSDAKGFCSASLFACDAQFSATFSGAFSF